MLKHTHVFPLPLVQGMVAVGLWAGLALPSPARSDWYVWTTGSQELVPLKPDPIFDGIVDKSVDNRVRLDVFRGEVEPFQVVLTPQSASSSLKRVRLVFAPLIHGKDPAKARAPQSFEWFKVGYFSQEGRYGGLVRPDLLMPVSSFDTFTDDTYNYPLWVRLRVPRDTPPGRYHGSLRVEAESGTVARIPLEVNVWRTSIPRQARFNTILFGFWSNHVAFQMGIPENSQEMRDLLTEGAERLADHRITCDNDKVGVIPYTPAQYDPLTPEGQQEVLRWCEFWTSRGLRLSCSFRVLNSRWFAEKDPERMDYARRFYATYAPLLRERGWADMVYTIIDDEFRGEEGAKRCAETGLFLKSLMPELQIAATGISWTRDDTPDSHRNAFQIASQVVTVWAQDVGIHLGPYRSLKPLRMTEKIPRFLSERAAAGDKIWPYIHGTLDFGQDGYSIRSFFWQLSSYGFDGTCLYSITDWGLEEANKIRPDRFGLVQDKPPADYYNGVGILFWPGDQRLLETFRLEYVRDGIEDWECFRRLEERLKRAEKAPGRYRKWRGQAKEALRQRAGQVSPFTTRPTWGVFEHKTDPAYFARARQSLGDALDATPAELRRTEEE